MDIVSECVNMKNVNFVDEIEGRNWKKEQNFSTKSLKPFRNRFITLRKNLTLMACYQHCRYVLCVSHQTFLLTIQMYRTKENDLTWRHASFSISALLLLWSLSWCLIWISDCLCSMLFIVVYLRTEFHKIMENSAILTRTYVPDTL